MIKALKDPSKLVRWRAAMFLYEVGDESALPALKEAENDPEFEVSLQIKMAIERIEYGEEAKGSVWKQMTESRKRQLTKTLETASFYASKAAIDPGILKKSRVL